MEWYPLRLQPYFSERPWGGRKLAGLFGRPLPEGKLIGESWEVYGDNCVTNGSLAGETLNTLCAQYGPALLGARGMEQHGSGFPLLVKLLDCNEWLSVQVHPDDTMARTLNGDPLARGKTECWFILGAEPGARLLHGFEHPVTPAEIEQATQAGHPQDLLREVTVKPGDLFFSPAGIVHALGPGIVLYELQQSSDITYRLYDWGRVDAQGKPRALHVAQAVRVIEALGSQPAIPSLSVPRPLGEVLVACPYFVLERMSGASNTSWGLDGSSFEIFTVIEGEVLVGLAQGAATNLQRGDSVVIPAAGQAVRINASRPYALLRAYVP